MSEPLRHHYIPVFYLKRWTSADGKLCEYTRPIHEVTKVPLATQVSRKAPKATAFVKGLYTVPGVPEDRAQYVEKKFLGPVDDWAARAMVVLMSPHSPGGDTQMDSRTRLGWAHFLFSLILRNPEYLVRIEQQAAQIFPETIEEVRDQYPLLRRETDPISFDEFKEKMLAKPNPPQSLLPQLLSVGSVVRHLYAMRWSTTEVRVYRHAFLTSDRPIVMTNGMDKPGSHIAIPLSPTRLFFAVKKDDEATYQLLRRMDPKELTEIMNERVSSQARKFVYGHDDTQLRFVSRRLGKMLASTPLG